MLNSFTGVLHIKHVHQLGLEELSVTRGDLRTKEGTEMLNHE